MYLVGLWHLVEELSNVGWLQPPALLHGPEVLDVEGPVVSVVREGDLNHLVPQIPEDRGSAPLFFDRDEDPVTRPHIHQMISSALHRVTFQFIFQILECEHQILQGFYGDFGAAGDFFLAEGEMQLTAEWDEMTGDSVGVGRLDGWLLLVQREVNPLNCDAQPETLGQGEGMRQPGERETGGEVEPLEASEL